MLNTFRNFISSFMSSNNQLQTNILYPQILPSADFHNWLRDSVKTLWRENRSIIKSCANDFAIAHFDNPQYWRTEVCSVSEMTKRPALIIDIL